MRLSALVSFFSLFLDKPIQELHGVKVLDGICGVIDRVDQIRNILLVLISGFQRPHIIGECLIRFINR